MATKKSTLKGYSPARALKMDTEAESSGVWRDIEGGAARLKVARFNHPAHMACLRKLREQHADVLKEPESKAAQDTLEKIGNQALAEHILTGWEGILDEDGETPLPFSKENALALLELDEFSSLVFQLSMDMEQYRKYKQDEAVKN